MIGYTLKHVLDLVPEALQHVKQASVEQDYPLTSRDNTIASALVANYEVRIAGHIVDPDVLEKVAFAVEAYGAGDIVSDLITKVHARNGHRLEKAASAGTPEKYMTKQAGWQGELSGFKDLEDLVKQAESLYAEAQQLGVEPSFEVKRYAGDAYLSKQAALGALNARYHLTKDTSFVKLAAAIGTQPVFEPSSNLVRSLCRTVTGLDKKAGLLAKGFDFYKEALMTKEAAYGECSCKVAGKDIPLTTIMRIPRHHVSNYLGDDVAKSLDGHPQEAKAVIDSLPMDSQQILATILKSA
jgi:hypothetical protein